MINSIRYRILVVLLGSLLVSESFGQVTSGSEQVRYNPILTAVPFLTITPDSRHGAMGDVGVATQADAGSQFANPSKYVFTRDRFGVSVSYTPWMRELVGDVTLSGISGYYRLDDRQALGSSLRYFSMGEILMTGADRQQMGTVSPGEYAFDLSYSRKLSEHLSGGIALRYIRSDLTGGVGAMDASMGTYHAGNAFSSDVSFYYINSWGASTSDNSIAFGVNLSNIGSKISYDQGVHKDFLPANLRLGTTYTRDLPQNSSFSFSVDLNKLMVPTPRYWSLTDAGGNVVTLDRSAGSEPVISSLFNSFSDAPGGMKEELQEVSVSLGAEFWYKERLALRGGYFGESQNKGDRKYVTTGVGVRMKAAAVDVSYAVPVRSNSAMANTIRFTLNLNLGSFTGKEKVPEESTPEAAPKEEGGTGK
jgi:hypothetical protein